MREQPAAFVAAMGLAMHKVRKWPGSCIAVLVGVVVLLVWQHLVFAYSVICPLSFPPDPFIVIIIILVLMLLSYSPLQLSLAAQLKDL